MITNIFKNDKLFSINDNINGYKIQKILGQGRYGIAYLGTKNKDKVVIKQLKNSMLKKSKGKVRYEEEILSKLNDNRFPMFISKFNIDNKKGYILEYKEGITFEEDIYKNDRVFTPKEIYDVGISIIEIIKELNKNNIVHKDIRVSNVITNNNQIYLIDFGLARYVNNEKYKREEDYWYLGDFLIHLHYTNYKQNNFKSSPWYEELQIHNDEILFLKKLMGIDGSYYSIEEVEKDFKAINNRLYKD